MLDTDEAVCGMTDDWFILAAGEQAPHGDSDDAAFDRWLASLPEGGLEDLLSRLLYAHESASRNQPAGGRPCLSGPDLERVSAAALCPGCRQMSQLLARLPLEPVEDPGPRWRRHRYWLTTPAPYNGTQP